MRRGRITSAWVVSVATISLFSPADGITGDRWQEIAEAVHKNYINPPPVETVLAIFPRAVKNYLKTLDPYSDYLTPNEYQREKKIAREGYDGIGVQVAQDRRGTMVLPLLGGPAEHAGIHDWHYLIAVNGRPVNTMDEAAAADLLTGPHGSRVTLTLGPISPGNAFDVTLTRAHFQPRSVELVPEARVPFIRIHSFVANETAIFLRVVLSQHSNNPIVIDLRDCPGGDFYEAVNTVSLFLDPHSTVAAMIDNGGHRQEFQSAALTPIVNGQVLLLVGPRTASSAELFAGTLQHYLKAILVGQKSYGKCVAQTYVELSDGSALRLTNRKILDAEGQFCEGRGLIPDLMVPDEELYQTNRLIDRGLRQLRREVWLACLSDALRDGEDVALRAKQIDIAMDIKPLRFIRFTRNPEQVESFLCMGPIQNANDAHTLAAQYSDALGEKIFVEHIDQ